MSADHQPDSSQSTPAVQPAQATEREPTEVESSAVSAQPAELVEILHTLADRWKELLDLVKGIMGEQRLRREGEGRFRLRMGFLGVAFLLAIVGTVAWLTYADKLDDSNFAFLLGIVVGAMLTLTRDLMTPPRSGG